MSTEVTSKEKKPGFIARVGKFFKDLRSEAKKVVWPTGKQTINHTWVVIVAIAVVGIFVGGLDMVFAAVRDFIVRLV